MKLYQIYFSPTGGTKRAADLFCGAWDVKPDEIDLSDAVQVSACAVPQPGDVCVVAVPSFGGRVPAVAVERLRAIRGNGASAAAVVVFGNRAFDDTLAELRDVLHACGFRCVAGVAAVAEHSIARQFGAGRPDEQDIRDLSAFSQKIRRSLEGSDPLGEPQIPGAVPYREYKGVPFHPRAGKNCIGCGACARACPVSAIPAAAPAETNAAKCISCMRCVAVCPRQARGIGRTALFAVSKMLKKACAERKQNELFLP